MFTFYCRWGSLANNERGLLHLLDGEHISRLQPTTLTLAHNSSIYARRHSAHSCPVTEEKINDAPPPVSLMYIHILVEMKTENLLCTQTRRHKNKRKENIEF